MARVGGRNRWIAAPAGLICLAVVAALVWLSLPMAPVVVAWVQTTFQQVAANPFGTVSTPDPSERPAAEAVDCRDLYPNALWIELTWRGDALLTQDFTPPATAATTVVDALAPTVRLSCRWRYDGEQISTTLARVSADAGPVAEAGLTAQGFACTTTDALLTCSKVEGRVLEEHAIGAGLWLASVETGWHPEGYGSQLAAHVW
jgi:hypothetical protein